MPKRNASTAFGSRSPSHPRRRVLQDIHPNIPPALGPRSSSPLGLPFPSGQPEPLAEPSPLEPNPLSSVSSSSASFDLQAHLVDLFQNLHTSDPNHAIFGPPTTGLLRLPLTSRRKNGQSWTNVAKKIAGWVLGEMGDKFSEKGCWMSRQYQLQITETNGAARPVILRQFLVCRLLAFLVDPSDEHWQYLDNGGIQHPFSHACGRGGKRSDGQTAFCINAVYHGRFETPAVNESRKTLCTNGARVLCPGHGTPATKCIFTHSDGVLQPCRNNDTMVPVCSCPRRCYG